MKKALIYYSLEGNTQYVAEKITEQLDVDVYKIKPKKEYPTGTFSKFLWGGKSVVMGDTPELEPYDFNPNQYDLIIIGTPIWASSYAPPIKTFLNENTFKDKKIALYTCSGGGDTKKCLDKFRESLNESEIVSTLALVNPKSKKADANDEKIVSFCQTLK